MLIGLVWTFVISLFLGVEMNHATKLASLCLDNRKYKDILTIAGAKKRNISDWDHSSETNISSLGWL